MEIQLDIKDSEKITKEQSIIMKYLKNKKIILDKILNKYDLEVEFHIIAKEKIKQ